MSAVVTRKSCLAASVARVGHPDRVRAEVDPDDLLTRAQPAHAGDARVDVRLRAVEGHQRPADDADQRLRRGRRRRQRHHGRAHQHCTSPHSGTSSSSQFSPLCVHAPGPDPGAPTRCHFGRSGSGRGSVGAPPASAETRGVFETTDSPVVARLDDVSKTHGRGPQAVHALQGVSLEFAAHGFTAIMGPSGSGKSSLLHVAAGLEPPDRRPRRARRHRARTGSTRPRSPSCAASTSASSFSPTT